MGILGKVWDAATDAGHYITGTPTADEKRNMQKQQRDQMAAYKKDRERAEYEVKRRRQQELQERARIDEKRIRHLRHHYASDGFFGGGGDEVTPGAVKDSLGA